MTTRIQNIITNVISRLKNTYNTSTLTYLEKHNHEVITLSMPTRVVENEEVYGQLDFKKFSD